MAIVLTLVVLYAVFSALVGCGIMAESTEGGFIGGIGIWIVSSILWPLLLGRVLYRSYKNQSRGL